MGEMFKKVPLPIWIGLGLVLLVILLMNRGGSSSSQAGATTTAPVGPVTTATVGTQGAQAGAGTDQELANLSSIAQSGFEQIAWQEQNNTQLLNSISGGMNGGTGMQNFGGSMQGTQNGTATINAGSGTPGQNAGSNPVSVGLPPTNGPIQAGG